MPKYASKDIAELAHQLQLSPTHKRLSQIKGIESLLAIIEPQRSYPYDLVCFSITQYRNRRELKKPAIEGEKLFGDLVNLAEQITRKTTIGVGDLNEPYRTYEELASDLQVSTKTIRRWRRRGLMGFRVNGDDGVGRLVYLKSTIDRFVEQNKNLVERGAAFKQLTDKEKDAIVESARQLLGHRRMKMHVIARKIAAQTGRAVETIRYTLRRYDQANPERALFAEGGVPAAPAAHRQIWEAFQGGDSLETISVGFEMTSAEVKRVIREMSIRCMKAEPVAYVHNELFDLPDADALILDIPRPAADSKPPKVAIPKDLPAYLRSLYETPLMNADQEVDAFRRYNYLKYKAAAMVKALDVCGITQSQLDEVARLATAYESIRQEIVKANLRLVVSIAKRHVGWSPRFFEIISDGNMSLLRAIEKFDYARGFKFSTYASWAIMKNFARTIPEQHYHGNRFVTGQDELLDSTADHRDAETSSMDKKALVDALREGMEGLNEREKEIVTSHFGLFGAEESSTLEDLGKRFGVTKERVRQIERRAISKIKSALSPAVADLLSD